MIVRAVGVLAAACTVPADAPAGDDNPDLSGVFDGSGGWGAAHGRLPEGAIVLLRNGWGERWGDRTAYPGTALTGPEAVPELRFPALDPEAAAWLARSAYRVKSNSLVYFTMS